MINLGKIKYFYPDKFWNGGFAMPKSGHKKIVRTGLNILFITIILETILLSILKAIYSNMSVKDFIQITTLISFIVASIIGILYLRWHK